MPWRRAYRIAGAVQRKLWQNSISVAQSLDENLSQLSGQRLLSERDPTITYRIEKAIGSGGMGVAFLGLREAPDGLSPVVVKVLRPKIVAHAAVQAQKQVNKEIAALTKLSQQVPPSPFVMHFIDAGRVTDPESKLTLPWIALEYVHGGIEGTTLQQRVRYSIAKTGSAFDRRRISHLLHCLEAGVEAVHGVDVIHRDLTPSNVLCYGFGEAEIFKVADLGLARVESVETFNEGELGTVAYSAPEQSFTGGVEIGRYTDVFSLACTLFFALTGEDYFHVKNVAQCLVAVQDAARRSLLDCQWLSPDLRRSPGECQALDRALSEATAFEPRLRPRTAAAFAQSVRNAWTTTPGAAAASQNLVSAVSSSRSPVTVADWLWTERGAPGSDRVILGVAWDSDGHALAATQGGVEYWDGTRWHSLPARLVGAQGAPRSVARTRAGVWLVGTDAGNIFPCGGEGSSDAICVPDGGAVEQVAGRLDGTLVAISQRDGENPVLWTWVSQRWLPPINLNEFIHVADIVPASVSRFLLVGRTRSGAAIGIYDTLHMRLMRLPLPATRALTSASSQQERKMAVACGSDGTYLRVLGEKASADAVPGGHDLSACALDIVDREWAAAVGRLWVRDGETPGWKLVWEDPSWQSPFVCILGEVGRVLAMTPDGAVLEGQALWHARRGNRPGPR